MADTLVIAEEDFMDRINSRLPFTLSGGVDAYYLYTPSGEEFPTSFTSPPNSFNLGMANIILSREGKVGFVADIAVGPRAEAANGLTGPTLAAIKQLYVDYSPADWLTFTLGNFGTFVGYEVIDATGNINYSTSYLFSNGPFYHTGFKADIALSDRFGLMVGVFNDTDNKLDETSGKHFGGQLSYASDRVGIYLNYLNGKEVEETDTTMAVYGHQFDLVATLQATERLGLGLNASRKIRNQEEADSRTWTGMALYANYAFSRVFTLGLRGEYFSDPDDQVLGVGDGNVLSLTASGNIHIDQLTLIPEFRLDMASDPAFANEDGDMTETLPGFLLAMVYAF